MWRRSNRSGQARRVSKILFLLPSNGFGGAERHTAMFAAHLHRIGCGVTIAAESDVLSRLTDEFGTMAGVSLQASCLGWREQAEFHQALGGQRSAATALLAKERPDVAILPLPWPNFGLGIQKALEDADVPALVIAHLVPHEIALEEKRFVSDYLRRPESWAWTAVSNPAGARLEEYFGLATDRVWTVPNAVDLEHLGAPAGDLKAKVRAQLGLNPGARIVLFAGRLDQAKGADLLPQICSGLSSEPEIVVLCAGEGALRDELDRASTDARNLKVLGYRRDLHNLIAASDALILPSRLEGWPLVFQEAAALGCPVVASAAALECLGVAAAECALTAETGETANFSAQIITVLNDLTVRERVIHSAKMHVVRYTTRDMWAGYDSLIRSVQ
jgi:glycosyltransferase involved in cell wall biosynthesis